MASRAQCGREQAKMRRLAAALDAFEGDEEGHVVPGS
jgi:hypothetical protein